MATAAQLRARALFAKRARAGTWRKGRKKAKRKVRRMKVRKVRVVRRRKSRPVRVSKGRRHMAGIASGINKKGLLLQAVAFFLGNGMTHLETLRTNQFSAPALSEVFRLWRVNSPLSYGLAHYGMWRNGDCGLANKLGLGIHVHRKALALQSFALTYGDAPKYYLHFKTAGVNPGTIATAANTLVKNDALAAGVAGVSLWKFGPAITVDGVN